MSGILQILMGAGGAGGIALAITAGVSTATPADVGYAISGHVNGPYGTMTTPTDSGSGGVLPSGKRIVQLGDANSLSYGASIEVDGFSADPGASSLLRVTLNGAQYAGSAATYSYISGNAVWYWGSTNKFGLSNGNSYAGSLVTDGSW